MSNNQRPRQVGEFKYLKHIHKYWSRKPWNLMNFEIQKHSHAGDLILDPFCGSGSVGLEAKILGRNFIGYDLNPAAIRIAETTLATDFHEQDFIREFDELIQRVKSQVMELYKHNDRYLLYTIPSSKNTADYNIVLCDYNFKILEKKKDINLKVSYGVPDKVNINIPDRDFPSVFYKDRFSYKGVKKVSDLFSSRSLLALEIIFKEINQTKDTVKNDFLIVLSNTLLHVTKLKSERVRPLGVNNYWIPDDFIEENVLWRFQDRAAKYKKAKTEINNRFTFESQKILGKHMLIAGNSMKMSEVEDSSIDYILTDPPYGDVIQYSELSYIWNTWFNPDQNFEDELIINPAQEKDRKYFVENLEKFLIETSRVLKPLKKITICFQNKDPNLWMEFGRIAYRLGFHLFEIEEFDFLGSTFNNNWSRKSPKKDLYITFLKPSNEVDKSRSFSSEISLNELIELSFQDSETLLLSNFVDPYSKLIGRALVSIFSGTNVVDITSKQLAEIINLSSQAIGRKNEDRQESLF